MNKYWRLLVLHLRTMFARLPQRPLWGIHGMRFRVTPTDLDLLRHMNNGTYLQLADVARIDMMIRSGAWRRMGQLGWISVVASETITFRRQLRIGWRFTIETQIIGWDEHCFIIEQHFVHDGEIAAKCYVRQLFVRRRGGILRPAAVLGEFGWPEALPEMPEWVRLWAARSQLPRNRHHTPSAWTEPRPAERPDLERPDR